MSKPKSPLHAFRAGGAIGRKVIFFHRGGQQLARSYHEYPVEIPIVKEIIMEFHELWQEIPSPGAHATWTPSDLTAWVPPEAKAVELHIWSLWAGLNSVGTREDGSAIDRRFTLIQYMSCTITVGVKDVKTIQLYADHASWAVGWHLTGYWV